LPLTLPPPKAELEKRIALNRNGDVFMVQLVSPLVRKFAATAALVLLSVPTAGAAEFVGDLTLKSARQTMTGRLFVKDSLYRMDFSQDAGKVYVLVDQSAGECRIVNPPARTYRILPLNAPTVVQNDPFQAARIGDSLGVRDYRGADTLEGFPCDRFTIRLGKNPLMNQWIPTRLGFPIRIENLMSPDSAYVAVTNIAIGPVDSALFVIPLDYSLQAEPSPPPRDPRRGAKAGDSVLVRLDTALAVEVGLIGLDSSGAECVVELLRDGKAIAETAAGPESSRTFRFAAVGEQVRRIYAVAADGLRVRVTRGEVLIDVSQPR